ncbi:MAG: hypothetical protein E7Z91_05285 [Cyanobacteria bacterium SIG30]|nr:hypothetical protein [Cyanobacteria bacterium SIG30]
MDKLNFITAGTPMQAGGYKMACDTLRELNLDGMEIEFVHGVRMSEETQEIMKNTKKNLYFTAHSPYYINLNAKEEEKVQASIKRILDTATMTESLGGYSIVYHAGFYLGKSAEDTYNQIKKCHEEITKKMEEKNLNIWIRPETTGKKSQWGDLDEVIKLSKDFNKVLPCIDFAHLHARSNGKFNTYDEFSKIFEKIGNELGQIALDNFHAHVAGIAYSEKGEKHHLILQESDMNYKDLLKAFKSFDIKGVVVCESPNIETDCKILKDYYLSI